MPRPRADETDCVGGPAGSTTCKQFMSPHLELPPLEQTTTSLLHTLAIGGREARVLVRHMRRREGGRD